jgi:two-component system chemotaxis sensor kinase CheA
MQVLFDDPDMQEIFEGFVVETNELLDTLQHNLMELEEQPGDLDLLNTIFRDFHTIKGTSGFMGFDDMASLTHHAEDLLNKFRKGDLEVTVECVDVLLNVWDALSKMLENKTEGVDEEVPHTDIIKKLEFLKKGMPIPDDLDAGTDAGEVDVEEEVEADEVEVKESDENKVVDANALDEILGDDTFGQHEGYYNDDELDKIQDAFAAINAQHKKEAAEKETNSDPLNAVLSNGEFGQHDGDYTDDEYALIDQAFAQISQESKEKRAGETDVDAEEATPEPEKVEEQKEVPEAPKEKETPKPEPVKATTPAKTAPAEKKPPIMDKSKKKPPTMGQTETIRIDVQRIENLMDLSGELVLGRNRLAQITNLMDKDKTNYEQNVSDLLEAMGTIDLLTADIQSAVMKMRMVQVDKLYKKAPRIVRDLAKESGKKMRLIVKGQETEIDRGIIEELNDPLVHMIRNSCDHGIEPANVRLDRGKPETGTITLDASQEGNHIVLKIIDDGAGMDAEVLKKKALERNVITEDQFENMSDKEAFQLIFAPGFSTAKKVTSVSGRGVGMDVVRTHIQKLKGIIEIESEKGVGSTFIIKLPLTLAIIQGLLVRVNKEIFAVPLNSVVEVVSISDADVQTVNNKAVIRIREEVLPIIDLEKILNVNDKNDAKEDKERYVVTVSIGTQSVGLVVDYLIGQEEIVIKSLGKYLGNIKGIAGSTILGDGRPIMILDVAQLLELVHVNSFMNAV